MKKRIYYLLTIIMILSLILSGCGNRKTVFIEKLNEVDYATRDDNGKPYEDKLEKFFNEIKDLNKKYLCVDYTISEKLTEEKLEKENIPNFKFDSDKEYRIVTLSFVVSSDTYSTTSNDYVDYNAHGYYLFSLDKKGKICGEAYKTDNLTSNQQQDWKKEYNSNISESDNEKTNTSMVVVTMSSQLSAFKLFVEAAEESGVKFVENGLDK